MVFTVTNVYIVQRINSLILNPDLFGDRFVSLLSPVTALTQSLLFSICPVIFKVLANIEGSATSMDKAEQKAIIYFWYFFIIARFMGQIIWNITLRFFFDGCEYGLFWFTQNRVKRNTSHLWLVPSPTLTIVFFFRFPNVCLVRSDTSLRLAFPIATAEDAINEGLSELAQTVPTTLGPSALSYILFSSTITWPALYFMPSLNFSTRFLRLNYLNRVLKKGYVALCAEGCHWYWISKLLPFLPCVSVLAFVWFANSFVLFRFVCPCFKLALSVASEMRFLIAFTSTVDILLPA